MHGLAGAFQAKSDDESLLLQGFLDDARPPAPRRTHQLPPRRIVPQPLPSPSIVEIEKISNFEDTKVNSQNQSEIDTTRHSRVFVRDLSSEVDNQKLKEAFQPFGDVSDAKVIRDTITTKSKGYGFVSYPKREEAERAIEQMNGHWLGRSKIRTNWATRKPGDSDKQMYQNEKSYDEIYNQTSGDNTSVYVGNIGNLAKYHLHNGFSEFGRFSAINVFKKYAIVEFERKDDATRAIVKTNNSEIGGQMVRCCWKRSDENASKISAAKEAARTLRGSARRIQNQQRQQEDVRRRRTVCHGRLRTDPHMHRRGILKKEHLETFKKRKKIAWIGLPYIIANGYFTYENDKLRYMVMPKYAISLEAVREANGGMLSVKDAFSVANCILGALEYLQDVDYAHANVKAANILLQTQGDFSLAVLVDFGLAHRTINNIDKPDKKRAHNGTCIFTSTDAHRGNNPSFRGDVEILAYNIIMWLTGTLSWMSLEASPEKVFDAKQKLIAGLPGTLQNVLKNHSSSVVGCLTTLFNVAMETNYTSKVDMEKLKKLVTDTVQKAPSKTEEAPTVTPLKRGSRRVKEEVLAVEEKEEVPSRSRKTRKTVKLPDSDDEDEEKKEEKKPAFRKTPRIASRRRVIKEDSDEEPEEAEVIIPTSSRSRRAVVQSPVSPRRPGANSSSVTINAAKKIEQKYKRLSMNKSSLVPVTVRVTSSPAATSSGVGKKRNSMEETKEEITLKTPGLIAPAIKKSKYKSGISSATKASPTELRRVPGVRNFPKGRRSMIIKETSDKYKERRAARQTFPDLNTSGSSDV